MPEKRCDCQAEQNKCRPPEYLQHVPMPHLVEESESSNGIIDTCINFLVIYGLSLCVTRYGWSNSMEKCIKKHILANPTFWHLHTNVSNVSSFTPWYLSCLFMNLCLVFQRSSATDLPTASVIRFLSTLPVVLHHAVLVRVQVVRYLSPASRYSHSKKPVLVRRLVGLALPRV